MTTIITVYGRPAPQGSKKAFRHRATGKIITQEMSKYVRPWRAEVQRAAQATLLTRYDQGRFPLPGRWP